MIKVQVQNASLVAGALASKGQVAETITQSGVRRYGVVLLAEVKENASHAPGPNIITGTYNGSISISFTGSGAVSSAEVYTDEDYGNTLEYGRGRVSPHPHFRPAADEVEPQFVNFLRSSIRKL